LLQSKLESTKLISNRNVIKDLSTPGIMFDIFSRKRYLGWEINFVRLTHKYI